MQYVEVKLVNGKPTVVLDTESIFDKDKFLESIDALAKEGDIEQMFRTDQERGAFVALLCGAFGFSTEIVNAHLPIREIAENLISERDKEERKLGKTASIGEMSVSEITMDGAPSLMNSTQDELKKKKDARDAVSSLFMQPLKDRESSQEADDENLADGEETND